MKRNVEIEIELTPVEIEKELWEMVSSEQVLLLVCMLANEGLYILFLLL